MKLHHFAAVMSVLLFSLAALQTGYGVYFLGKGLPSACVSIGGAVLSFGFGVLWTATFAVWLRKAGV